MNFLQWISFMHFVIELSLLILLFLLFTNKLHTESSLKVFSLIPISNVYKNLYVCLNGKTRVLRSVFMKMHILCTSSATWNSLVSTEKKSTLYTITEWIHWHQSRSRTSFCCVCVWSNILTNVIHHWKRRTHIPTITRVLCRYQYHHRHRHAMSTLYNLVSS